MKKTWKEINRKWDERGDIYTLRFAFTTCPVLIAAYVFRMAMI